jgi:DNA-binding response OmpR family regulator
MTIMRKMILIVDDDPDIARTLKISLEDNGFVVESFYDLRALTLNE